MLLTVIVTIYNKKKYLVQCINSIIGQTYKNLQIILVDDGSTDGCSKICDGFANRDFRVEVIHQKNSGLVMSRKAGLSKAKGEYCTFVDADDWIELNAYEALMNKTLNGVDCVSYGVFREYGNKQILKTDQVSDGIYNGEQFRQLIKNYTRKNSWYSYIFLYGLWSKIFRTDLLIGAYRLFDLTNIINNEDTVISLGCLTASKKICVFNKSFYHYRILDNSMSHKDYESADDNLYRVSQNLIKIANIYGIDCLYIQYLIYFCISYQTPRCIFGKGKEIICYPKVNKEQNIIIYGKGRFSKLLQEYIILSKYCNIVDVIDISDVKSREEYLLEYDAILIAIIDGVESAKSAKLLIQKGYEEDRIFCIDKNALTLDILPERIRKLFL